MITESDPAPLNESQPQGLQPEGAGLERVKDERSSELQRADIDALKAEGMTLRSIEQTLDAVEAAVLYSGLQTVADKYGVDKVLDLIHVRESNGITSTGEFLKAIAPDKSERAALVDMIENADSAALYQRLNEVGGLDGNHSEASDRIDATRRTHVEAIKSGGHYPNGGGERHHFMEDNVLFSSELNDALDAHPELVDQLREHGDLITFLGGLREAYGTERTAYEEKFSGSEQAIESLVAQAESDIAQQADEVETILAQEVAALEQKLAASGGNIVTEALQKVLDARAGEVQSFREGIQSQLDAVRAGIYEGLGLTASGLDGYRPPQPIRLTPIETYKQWVPEQSAA